MWKRKWWFFDESGSGRGSKKINRFHLNGPDIRVNQISVLFVFHISIFFKPVFMFKKVCKSIDYLVRSPSRPSPPNSRWGDIDAA